MAASAKLYLSLGLNYIPQMDFATQESENGGVSASQSFLIRKSDVGVGAALSNFRRGTRLEIIDPNCPSLYRTLTLKDFPIADHAPGMMRVEATFTGYAFSTNGSSGEEQTVPTYSLTGNLEEAPLNEHKKWAAMTDNEKWALGKFLGSDPEFVANRDFTAVGMYEEFDSRNTFYPALDSGGSPIVFSEEAKKFIRMIGQNKTTFKKPSWNYTQRSNSKTGFTSAQLATLGHIVANPPGNPTDPGTGYTWLSIGPSQEQSGPDLFYKDLPFMLIEDNDENQFLYGD